MDQTVVVTNLKSEVDGFRPASWHSLTRVVDKVCGMLRGLKNIPPKLGAQRTGGLHICQGAKEQAQIDGWLRASRRCREQGHE